MTIQARLLLLTVLGLAFIMFLWGWIQIRSLDRTLVDQHGKRLIGLAETVSHFYNYFPTTEGITALDNSLRDQLMLDGRLARLDIISLGEDDIDHIAGASRIYFEWPEQTIAAARKHFRIHNVREETENGPALGLLYPVIQEKDRKTYVGILSYSRSYNEIIERSKYFLLISSFGFIVLIMVVFAISYRWLVDRPLRIITRTIGNIEKGHYVDRIPVMRQDELGRLATQFNAMAATIEQVMVNNRELNRTLEQRVEEATAHVVQLQKELNQLQKLNALGYLTANIAHDMGTPLHSIAGLAKLLLEEGTLTENSRHKLELIVLQTERLNSTISNIRRATRLPEPVFENINVADLIQETKILIDPLIKQQDIHLIIDSRNNDGNIIGDRHRLQTALFNLIENSREAMQGSGTIKIRVDGDATPEMVTISVEDDGPGIPEEIRERIWKPFFTTHEGEGLRGLGLSIVHDIVKLHGGLVCVTSTSDRGAKVEMKFPRYEPPPAGLVKNQPDDGGRND